MKFVAVLSRNEGPIVLIFMTINGVVDRYDRGGGEGGHRNTHVKFFWYAFARATSSLTDVNGTNCYKDLHLAFMFYSLYTDDGIYFSLFITFPL